MSAPAFAPIDRTVAWLTMRQLFARRRLIAAAVFALLPLVFALAFRSTHALEPAETMDFLTELYREIVLGTLLQLTAVVLGTTAFGGEVDDGTIVYLLVKPLPRWTVVLTKYLVAVAATIAVVVPGIFLAWLAAGAGGVVPVRVPVAFAGGAAVGAAIYGAIFLALGLRSRRALVQGLLYVVVVEFVMSRSIPGLRSLSVREFALTVAGRIGDGLEVVRPGGVSPATAWTMGTIFLVASLAAAVRQYQRFELAERL